MTAVIIRGKKLDTASLGEIRIEVTDVDLAKLSQVALLELGRCFARNVKKFRRSLSGRTKKLLRTGIEQLAQQLTAEMERRRRSEPAPAAPLKVISESIEAAAVFASFLEGLRETYISQRAKVMPQSEIERNIADLKSAAFESGEFCRAIAAAIYQHEIEVQL